MPPKNLLCVIVARIGDTLLTTPTLHALKTTWPETRLHVVAHPRQRPLLENNPDVDRLQAFTKKSANFKGWWSGLGGLRKPMDIALVYGHDRALWCYARRMSSRIIGFQGNDRALDALVDEAVFPVPAPMHAVQDRALLLQPLGIALPQRRLRYLTTREERQWAKTWLRDHVGGPRIGIQANSFATKAYRNLLPRQVKRILQGMPQRLRSASVLLFGGPADRENNETIRQTLGDGAVNLAGRFALRQSAALMEQMDFFLGIDTGPTHIAGCFDNPMVALYHCKHPGRNLMPLDHPRCAIVEHPDTDGHCPREASMADLPMAEIHAAITQVTECPG